MKQEISISKSLAIFGRLTKQVAANDFNQLVAEIASEPEQSAYFCNVHMLMLSQEDPKLANAMDSADWVFADSAPVAWLQRRISGKNAKVIPGYNIMLAICDRAVKYGENIGFLGSTPEVMSQLINRLSERFEGLSVARK